jgi:hypothetical protein
MDRKLILILALLCASCSAQILQQVAGNTPNPSICTTFGNTFTEGFGDDGSALNWASGGNSNFYQTWTVVSGTAPAVVSSPGTLISGVCPNSIEFTVAGQISAYDIPHIPAGTTFDLYFTFYLTTSTSNFNTVMQLYDSTVAAYVAQFKSDGNGSYQMQGSTASSAVTPSKNVWHLMRIHIQSGASSSYVNIDGGANATFTANSNGFNELDITGIASNTYYFGNVYVPTNVYGPGPCNIDPNMIVDFTGNTSGTTISQANLNSGTEVGTGRWDGGGAFGTDTYSNTVTPAFYTSKTACGTSNTGSVPGVMWKHDLHASNVGRYAFTTNSANASFGFLFYNAQTLSDTTQLACGWIAGTATDYAECNIQSTGTQAQFNVEVACGGVSHGNNVNYSLNTLYWMEINYIGGGEHTISLYNASTGALVGTSTATCSSAVFNPAFFELGHSGNSTTAGSEYIYLGPAVGSTIVGNAIAP